MTDPDPGPSQGTDKSSETTGALRGRVQTELERKTRVTTGPATTDKITERRAMDMGNIMNPIDQKKIAGADLLHQLLEGAERHIQQEE